MPQVNIIGKIIDGSTNEELIQANIKISKNGENFGGFVTNANGNFGGVKDLEVGTYTFTFSYISYNTKSFTKQVTSTTKEINFDTLKLVETDSTLSEISVEASSEPFTGTIIDSRTKEPIAGANIILNQTPPANDTPFSPGQPSKAISQVDGTFKWDVDLFPYTFNPNISNESPPTYKVSLPGSPDITGTITFKIMGPKRQAIIKVSGTTKGGYTVPDIFNDGFAGPESFSDFEVLAQEAIFNVSDNVTDGEGLLVKTLIDSQIPKETKYKPLTAIVSAKEYSQSGPIQLVNGNGQLKKDLGIIKLSPLEEEIQDQIIENKTLTETQKKIAAEESPKKDFISSTLKKIFRTIQDRLIPIILRQIAAFGVSKFNEEVLKNIDKIPKTCPPNIESLNKLIDKKNKLTKQLNNLYKSINSINKFLEIPPRIIGTTEKTLFAAKGTVQSLAFIPSSVATPNPVGPVLVAKDLIEKSEDLISILKDKIGVGTLQLRMIIEELRKVILLLDILDALIQTCAEEISDDDDNVQTQTAVSQQLLNSTQQQSQQLSPVVTNVNGFDMSVITEDGETEFDLKRRRAVAKNKAGIIMLKGELSFSSNDQILIDELIFYIQQNDLKAE